MKWVKTSWTCISIHFIGAVSRFIGHVLYIYRFEVLLGKLLINNKQINKFQEKEKEGKTHRDKTKQKEERDRKKKNFTLNGNFSIKEY